MPIPRIVPYVEAAGFADTEAFYTGVLGLEVGMPDSGNGFLGLVSPSHPGAQIIVAAPGVEEPLPSFGVDVGDVAAVDAAHAEAERRGLEIVYGPADEPWGIRRFFVRDPSGTVVSVLAHVA